jgi:hypothetical protein
VYAGAWGEGPFDNDDALDWATECAASKDVAFIETTLRSVMKERYVEAPAGSAAIAAAEVVAAALGKPAAGLPKQLADWIAKQSKEPIANQAPLARDAVRRVARKDGSELRELWEEGSSARWLATIDDLEGRLQK